MHRDSHAIESCAIAARKSVITALALDHFAPLVTYVREYAKSASAKDVCTIELDHRLFKCYVTHTTLFRCTRATVTTPF